MRLHRFYTAEPVGAKNELKINSAELVNQLRRVFRLKEGDSVVVFDGSGSDYECRISEYGKNSVALEVISSSKSRFMPERDLVLVAAVVKKDKFEWIVEKATELGATEIFPVMAERSEKKGLNEIRLKKIAIEASEQSGRGNIPAIKNVVSLQECIEELKKINEGKENRGEKELKLIAFDTEVQRDSLDAEKNDSVAVFIGPEGGWSREEIGLFHKNGVETVCLGSQVLRAETAALSALSLLVFEK